MAEPLDRRALALRIGEMPPLPQAVVELMQLLRHESLSVNRCIALIESDPALAARTLRLANSAFYGVPGRVGSIVAAVRMLGLRTVSSALTAAALQTAVRVADCPAFDFDGHKRHAIATALAARELGVLLGMDAEEAFLAGLLHDVGQLMLAACAPAEASLALAWAREHQASAVAAETAVLGWSHPQIGAMVAERWHFPPALVRAIAQHHEPDAPDPGRAISLSGLLQAADAIAHALDGEPGNDPAASMPARLDRLWPTLPMSFAPEAAQRLCAHVRQGTRELVAIFQATSPVA
jgi:putative nucleotidyltransferase with HDIG domain